MTEKSEDQVIWVCPECSTSFNPSNRCYCEPELISYIPLSQLLALQWKLKEAVYALEKYERIRIEPYGFLAKEALGKIG